MKKLFLLLFAAGLFINLGCSKKTVDPGTDNSGTTSIPFPNGKPVPTGALDGVTYINNGTSAIFNLTAPGKQSAAVIGEFNNWTPTAMTPTTDGTHWGLEIDNIEPNKEYAYQYLVDVSLKVADP